jgi:hypothetical protein
VAVEPIRESRRGVEEDDEHVRAEEKKNDVGSEVAVL